MTKRPVVPSLAELTRFESIAPGQAKKLLDLYEMEWKAYIDRQIAEREQFIRNHNHSRFVATLSVACGTFLATGAMALCVFALERHEPITPVAGIISAVSVLAGVFLWKSQPDRAKRPNQRSISSGRKPRTPTATTNKLDKP